MLQIRVFSTSASMEVITEPDGSGDVLGRQVATLADGVPASCRIERRLEARRLPSGVYFVRLVTGGEIRTTRLTVLHENPPDP